MKRQRAKFPWDFYWENKTYKLKRSIFWDDSVPALNIYNTFLGQERVKGCNFLGAALLGHWIYNLFVING